MDNNAMFKLGYGLYVLTAKDGKDNGCIVNTVMQITITPNRMMVMVNKLNLTHDMMVNTKEFNVSVLTEKCAFQVFEHFGYQSGKNTDKFLDYKSCKRADNGIYYVTEGSNSYISGKVTEMIDCGTHTMFIADVTDAVILNEDTSVTYDYYQKNIKPKPEQTKKSGYRCIICGYIYEGDELPDDYICPICKHGASDFEKL
jgi:flavin reductase (DIM6/NTAB) family NADH-FMN oxidoreductase RutF/rubredoxin